MKEALIIFMILLLLLMIISVFGGSIRFTPPAQQQFQSTRYERFSEVEGKKARFTQQDEQDASKETYYNNVEEEIIAGSPRIKEAFEGGQKEEIMQRAKNVITDIVNTASGSGGAIEPFQPAGEFASFTS